MSDKIRLAICQIECHPALYRGRLAYLEEPFVPESYEVSLSRLGSFGIHISSIQQFCKDEYIKWHAERIKTILNTPLLNGEIPTVVVFPEGSIPIDCLSLVRDYAKRHNIVIIAGTHTVLDTQEARNIYKMLGKEKEVMKKSSYMNDLSFIFVADKIHLHKKKGLSPFDRSEVTDLAANGKKTTIHPIPIPIGLDFIRMAFLVCSEALLLPNIKGDYDIVCISSYDGQPKKFDSYIDTQVRNGKVVIYCNDGKYGGSFIGLPVDKRVYNEFYNGPLNGRLPEGEGIIIVDIPRGPLATQVGVTNPITQMELKLLASIRYTKSLNDSHLVGEKLTEVFKIKNNQGSYTK